MPSAYPTDEPRDLLSIVIVGNDALIEALPARPIQLAHACRAAGFDLVLPESWGDELVAGATLEQLEARRGESAVFCACPIVRQRLLAVGVDLASLLVSTVAPPVAAARYARTLYAGRVGQLAFVGNCPAAIEPEFDFRYSPREFFDLLRRRGIDPVQQPTVFDAVLPPDRRRFISLPGGCPSPDELWRRSHERSLVSLETDDLAVELAQHLLGHQPVLADMCAALGCSCSGVTPATTASSARIAVMSLEPPRATSPVVDPTAVPTLDAPVERQSVPPPRELRLSSLRLETPTEAHALGVERALRPVRPPMAITPTRAFDAVHESGLPSPWPAMTSRGSEAEPMGAASPEPLRAAPETRYRTPYITKVPSAAVEPDEKPPAPEPEAPNAAGAESARESRERAIHLLPRVGSGGFPVVRVATAKELGSLPRAYMRRRPHGVRHWLEGGSAGLPAAAGEPLGSAVPVPEVVSPRDVTTPAVEREVQLPSVIDSLPPVLPAAELREQPVIHDQGSQSPADHRRRVRVREVRKRAADRGAPRGVIRAAIALLVLAGLIALVMLLRPLL